MGDLVIVVITATLAAVGAACCLWGLSQLKIPKYSFEKRAVNLLLNFLGRRTLVTMVIVNRVCGQVSPDWCLNLRPSGQNHWRIRCRPRR